MNLTQFRYLREIVRSGNITAAAKNLFITQPAITKQIKLLEDELECKLFYRSGRKLLLTKEGELVYKKALEIFERIKILGDELNTSKKIISGNVSVGCGPIAARYILPDIIDKCLILYPKIRFQLLR